MVLNVPSTDAGVAVLGNLLVGLLGSTVGGTCDASVCDSESRDSFFRSAIECGGDRYSELTLDLVGDVVGGILDGLHFGSLFGLK